MILVHRCFQEVDEESAEHGDSSDSGFIVENEPYGFRELVDALRTHSEPSSYPSTGETHEWFTQECGETRDFIENGTSRQESIHYSRDNSPRAARYWRLACIAAGHCAR